ncbi:nucleotidyltransferase domain-containing protein [Rheinheimera sp.]|uniref:nucleotidyltransferase family protein n=1 Tax=Rheinheimera sp. TaxID=1869214 RepID=UPI00307E28D4
MHKPDRLQVSASEWQELQRILQQYLPQHEVWAFGSRVDGPCKPFSDLDLVILTEQPMPLAAMAELSEAFSESNLPWKVDLVDWATTAESFRAIIRAGKLAIHPLKNVK